ncbi:MAG: ABC transporter permease [Acidisphaera sp.]|nr:ABC transporter permease [Acidisphaera sp.]
MRGRHAALRVFYWGAVVWLFLPLALIAVMSVTGSSFVGFPIERVTMRWYGDMLRDAEFLRAFLYSCGAAAGSTVLALAAGLWTALAISALRSTSLRATLFCAACLPIVTPGIVSAISLRIFIRLLGLDPGYMAIVLGHAIHAAPLVVIMLVLRLRTMPTEQVEAARTLGAHPARAFLDVTLPWLAPAIAGAAVLALLESFDDFLRSFFLGGYQPTLPVLIYGRLFSGLSPEINAIATVVLLLTISIGFAGERLFRRAQPA